MEMLLRLLIYAVLGLLLLGANLWFFASVRSALGGGGHVVRPFVIIGQEGQESSERAGLALAQMAVSRLATIQDRLREAQSRDTGAGRAGAAQTLIRVTPLFVPRQVEIPTSLVEPVNIQATVGGVELGGVIAWLRNLFSSNRALKFTVYQREDRAIVSADLGGFSGVTRHLWLESGKDPDEIASNVAYALVWLKVRENQSSRIGELDFKQFRELVQTVAEVDNLNRQVAQGHQVETKFLALLPQVEAQLREIPRWPELIYLAASIADGAANTAKATAYYRALADMGEKDRGDAAKDIFRTAEARLGGLGAADADVADEDRVRFALAASEFARQMALKGPDPQIAFVEPEMPEIQAIWNADANRYEVNPSRAKTEGLPQYVALMGRFMAKNYAKCMKDGTPSQAAMELWNTFRYSVVDYLIRSEARFSNVDSIAVGMPLFEALRTIEARSSAEATRRLALEMLDRFDCDWTISSLPGHMLRINRERGLMSESIISDATAGIAPAGARSAESRAGRKRKKSASA